MMLSVMRTVSLLSVGIMMQYRKKRCAPVAESGLAEMTTEMSHRDVAPDVEEGTVVLNCPLPTTHCPLPAPPPRAIHGIFRKAVLIGAMQGEMTLFNVSQAAL